MVKEVEEREREGGLCTAITLLKFLRHQITDCERKNSFIWTEETERLGPGKAADEDVLRKWSMNLLLLLLFANCPSVD